MKKLFVILGLTFAAALGQSQAQAGGPTAAWVVAGMESSDNSARTQALIYANGVSGGFFAMESALLNRKQPLIFCPPRDLVLSPEDLVALVKASIAAVPAVGALEFQAVALKALERRFPCR